MVKISKKSEEFDVIFGCGDWVDLMRVRLGSK